MSKNNAKDLYDALSALEVFASYTTDVYGDTPTNTFNKLGSVDVFIVYTPYDFEHVKADNIMHIMASTFKVEVICNFPEFDWVPAFINEMNDGGRRSCVFDNVFIEIGMKHYVFNINYLGGK